MPRRSSPQVAVRVGGVQIAVTIRDSSDVYALGPFVEGKEVVSGYVEAELADLDEALRLAKSWSACPVVEIRPAS
ncbi:hypothetical protein [Streptosporangium sp. NPDC000396]|uniref:hypothetical protein n=1 Tax=Streptosporangium sp. NPDC000396 TaxID=3366185 RepID=UPI0036A9E469